MEEIVEFQKPVTDTLKENNKEIKKPSKQLKKNLKKLNHYHLKNLLQIIHILVLIHKLIMK